MWMKLSNGREELIVNEDHIKRLKGEGAVEIADPRTAQPETPQEPEQPQGSTELGSGAAGTEQPSQEGVTDGSENVNEQPDNASTPDDQRSGNDTTVQRSKRAR